MPCKQIRGSTVSLDSVVATRDFFLSVCAVVLSVCLPELSGCVVVELDSTSGIFGVCSVATLLILLYSLVL